ncbi:hypothetical protein DU53_10815 [Kosmotoga sp. DU53]|nr:hypothetical protein DU53_10815 [Kosmotoga sp. DU53]
MRGISKIFAQKIAVLLEIFLEFLTTSDISSIGNMDFRAIISSIVPCSRILDIIKLLFFLISRLSISTSQKHLFDRFFFIFITKHIIS